MVGLDPQQSSVSSNLTSLGNGCAATPYSNGRHNFITPPPSNSPVVSSTPPSSLNYSCSSVSSISEAPHLYNNNNNNGGNIIEPSFNSNTNKSSFQVHLPQTSPITPTSPVPPTTFGCVPPRTIPPSTSGPIMSASICQRTSLQHSVSQPFVASSVPSNNVNSVSITAAAPTPSPTFVCSSPSRNMNKSPAYAPNMSFTQDELFELQLRTDQKGALSPDFKTPFKSKLDACKRLIRYHVFSDRGPSKREVEHTEALFESHSEALLKKSKAMIYKYQSLLLKDSQRRHATAEVVMLYRMHLQDERNRFEKHKSLVEAGRGHELPLVPPRVASPSKQQPSQYPWEDNWADDKVFTFSPLVFDEQKEEEEELSDDDLMFKGREDGASPHGFNYREEINTPSGASREELNTPYGNNLCRFDADSPSTSADRPVSRLSSRGAEKSLPFSERFKKTQKIQEDLYEKLLGNSSPSKEDSQFRKAKSSPSKSDNWEEDGFDDPPALQIMEESDTEILEEINNKEDDSVDLSPERLRDDRGFARRDSIVYRRSSSDESDVSCDSPELRVVTCADSPSPSKKEVQESSGSSLEARFNVLCKENGIDCLKRKFRGEGNEEASNKHCRYENHLIVPPQSLVSRNSESCNDKCNKNPKSCKDGKKAKLKVKSSIDKRPPPSPPPVPPLKIKTEEKSAGRLKLTLKKQSTGDYKSVSEEKQREYVVTRVSAEVERNGSMESVAAVNHFDGVGVDLNKAGSGGKNKKRETSGASDDRKKKKSLKGRDGIGHYNAGLIPFATEGSKAYKEWYSPYQTPIVPLHLPPSIPTAVAPTAPPSASALQHRNSGLPPPGTLLNHHLRDGNSYPASLPLAPYQTSLYQPQHHHSSYY